jgi:hypothetical protein
LNQKGTWPGAGVSPFPGRRCRATGGEAEPTPSGIHPWNVVSPSSSPRGRPAARGLPTGRRVKDEGGSEGRSVIEWIGVEPSGRDHPTRKRADFPRVSPHETVRTTGLGGRADDGSLAAGAASGGFRWSAPDQYRAGGERLTCRSEGAGEQQCSPATRPGKQQCFPATRLRTPRSAHANPLGPAGSLGAVDSAPLPGRGRRISPWRESLHASSVPSRTSGEPPGASQGNPAGPAVAMTTAGPSRPGRAGQAAGGACTAFTYVAACLLAEPPRRPVVSKASSPPPPLR